MINSSSLYSIKNYLSMRGFIIFQNAYKFCEFMSVRQGEMISLALMAPCAENANLKMVGCLLHQFGRLALSSVSFICNRVYSAYRRGTFCK